MTSYFTDMPGMGVYFFSYEWILNKLTLEGERFVSIIMPILMCSANDTMVIGENYRWISEPVNQQATLP